MIIPDPATYFLQLLPLLPGVAVALLFVSAALSARRELDALATVKPAPLTRPLTVIIPARNEADRLGPTLDALLAEPSEALSVIVFDDGSTDATADLVRSRAANDQRLQLVDGATLVDDVPRDGFGKPIALARALTQAGDADHVLFLDADVILSEGALGGMLAALHEADADVLSGGPQLICQSAAEAMLVPAFVSLVTSRYRPSRVHDQARPEAFLNGQLVLIKRAALDEVGGWTAVRHTVLEDVALGHRLKQAHKKIALADLRPVAATRMYTSLAEIRQGFGKNAVPLHGGAIPTLLLGVGAVLIAWAPWVSALWALAVGPVTTALGGFAVWLSFMGLQAALRRQMGVAEWPVLLAPLFYLVVAAVLVQAGLKGLRGGTVTWRGRTYQAERVDAAEVAAEGSPRPPTEERP